MSNKSIDKLAAGVTHTPGPWYVGRHLTGLYIQFDHGLIKEATICAMNTPCLAYSNAANDAHLIAAAPELLEALKNFDLTCYADVLNPCWDNRPTDKPGKHWGDESISACRNCIAKAAIAKAEGRQ